MYHRASTSLFRLSVWMRIPRCSWIMPRILMTGANCVQLKNAVFSIYIHILSCSLPIYSLIVHNFNAYCINPWFHRQSKSNCKTKQRNRNFIVHSSNLSFTMSLKIFSFCYYKRNILISIFYKYIILFSMLIICIIIFIINSQWN